MPAADGRPRLGRVVSGAALLVAVPISPWSAVRSAVVVSDRAGSAEAVLLRAGDDVSVTLSGKDYSGVDRLAAALMRCAGDRVERSD